MLAVTDLYKSYGSDRSGSNRSKNTGDRVNAVDGVTFDVADGELFTLLGPSGCGKTTTLRSIAGLERPDGGSIKLSGTTLFDADRRFSVPPNKRHLGMVFQSYAIWPHLSVFKNVSFPLEVARRGQRPPRKEIRTRVYEILEVTGLAGYADRLATNLSGGQQQRLALARAMVNKPSLTLFDEPLSNLDAKLRESMRMELKRVQRELGLTAVYVTHDQSEALMLSDRIAVMHEGKIVQVDRPEDLYLRPASRFVAEFIGTCNLVKGVLVDTSGELAKVDTSFGAMWTAARDLPSGTDVLLAIRPENVTIAEAEPVDAVNQWCGTVVTRDFLGDRIEYVVRAGTETLQVRSVPTVVAAPGDEVYVSVPPQQVTVVPN
jgi:iron(III) transport system ATP-binding protein